MIKIELEEGKYTVINNNGVLSALRYGEPWRENMMAGDKLVLALVHRIEELEDKFKRLENPERHFPVEVFSPGQYSITRKAGNLYFQKMEAQEV